MKLPVDKTWSIAIVMVVTYAITVAILLIERRSGEAVSAVPAPAAAAPLYRHDASPMPAAPRRMGPPGLPGQGPRPRQPNPAQPDPG